MLLMERTTPVQKPRHTTAEKQIHELNNSAGWLYVAIEKQMSEYVGSPVADLTTVENCIDFLEHQIRVLKLINTELQRHAG